MVSGPLMLQSAAMEAIREARYQPYRLNGEPTEVQTTITVNFRIGRVRAACLRCHDLQLSVVRSADRH